MAEELKFIIDGADRGQPGNPEDFGITISEDSTIGARVVSFNNDLEFSGTLYNYLFDKLKTSGYCGLVYVQVQYRCGNSWQRLVDGYIIATECQFDLDRCIVRVKVYDETFSTKINNNKAIPFSLSGTQSKNGKTITAPNRLRMDVFNPAIPADPPFSSGRAISVYDAFTHLVALMSDGLVDFDSNYFAVNPAGQAETYVVCNGLGLRTGQDAETVISFETLYNALRLKLNLGMGFEKQANNRPLLRIEPISYFYQSAAVVNLYDQPNIQMQFDRERLYSVVEFGANPMLEQNECNGGETSCTFAQTPFRGFREEAFGFSGECNTDNKLELATSSVIFDTNVIEDIVRFGATDYDRDAVIIQAKFVNSLIDYYEANDFDPYNIGQKVYNGGFTNEAVSANWLSGYPNSLYSFLENPFTPSQTEFDVRVSNLPAQSYQTNTDGSYFSQYVGLFIYFQTEVSDPNNLFLDSDYVVPFTGLYTFNAQIIRFPTDPLAGNITQFAAIRHFDSNDTIVNTYLGAPIVENPLSFCASSVTASFICNQGDIVRVDFWSASQNGTPTIEIADDFSSQFSEFSGQGEPLTGPELDPVNIDAVQAYVYKFNRPLSMQQIMAIADNTSKPILLGRFNDPLRVVDTYIKTINIASVIRKNAEFELKSNKLIQ